MLPPMVVLSPSTKKHTLVSFNRVIIVASSQISSRVSFLDGKVFIAAKEQRWQDIKLQRNKGAVRRVRMLHPVVVISPPTQKHTPGSFNRVIIAASGQTSRVIFSLGQVVTIDAKKETKQDKQKNYPERATTAAAAAAAAAAADHTKLQD